MLIGTKPENALKAPTQATVFVEDLSSEQAAALERVICGSGAHVALP